MVSDGKQWNLLMDDFRIHGRYKKLCGRQIKMD